MFGHEIVQRVAEQCAESACSGCALRAHSRNGIDSARLCKSRRHAICTLLLDLAPTHVATTIDMQHKAPNHRESRVQPTAGSPGSDRWFRRRVLLTCAIVSVFVAAWLAMWIASNVMLLVFAGILLAIFLHGLSEVVARYSRLRHGASLAVVLACITVLITSLAMYLAPKINEQSAQLAADLPHAAQSFRDRVESTPGGRYVLRELEVDQLLRRPQVVSGATGFATATVGVLFSAIVVLFIGLYAAYDPALYVQGMEHMMPHAQRDRYRELTSELYSTLWWWLVGRISECLFVGVLTTVGLWMIGVPLALTLGIIAGILNFIPNIGPLIAFIPAGMIAASQSVEQLAWTALLFLIVQSLESYVLTPIVQHRLVMLAPVLVLTSQILFWLLFGFLGLFLATPVAAALLVAIKVLYVRPVIGDHVEM